MMHSPGMAEWQDGVHHYALGTGFVAEWEVGRRCRFSSVSDAAAALRGGWGQPATRSRMIDLLRGNGLAEANLRDDDGLLGELSRRVMLGEVCLFDTHVLAPVPTSAPAKSAGTVPAAGATWDVDAAVTHLVKAAKTESTAKCATYVRQAIEAGSLALSRPNPVPAKEYGPYLAKNGFVEVTGKDYQALKGDIIVIQNHAEGNRNGHIAMYSGKAWISDFVQKDFWGGPGYRKHKPAHAYYRWPAKAAAKPAP